MHETHIQRPYTPKKTRHKHSQKTTCFVALRYSETQRRGGSDVRLLEKFLHETSSLDSIFKSEGFPCGNILYLGAMGWDQVGISEIGQRR